VGEVIKKGAGGALRTITGEDIRRYWPIGLVSLIVYISMGPLQLILADDADASGAAWNMATNYTLFAVVAIIAAVISAVVVFRYLHSPSALSVIRALPVSAKRFFCGSFISGLLLTLVPITVCALATLPFSGSVSDVGEWFAWYSAVCVTSIFTYAVSVLAGMTSGNMPVHVLSAAAFNFAWIFIYLFAMDQIGTYLLGFPKSGAVSGAVTYFHPFLYFMSDADIILLDGMEGAARSPAAHSPTAHSPAAQIIYLLAALGVAACAWLVFRRLKAERAGQSITARPAEYVFTFVATAAGLMAGSLILGSFDGMYTVDRTGYDMMHYVNPYYVVGAFVGALVAFIVVTMILRGSARVFDLVTLRRFAVAVAAVLVFMLCTMTNITGYETRVPKADNVTAAAFSMNYFTSPPYKYNLLGDSAFYDDGSNYTMYAGAYIPIVGRDDAGVLAAFHRKALEDKAYIEGDDMSIPVGVGYRLRVGPDEERSYMIRSDYLRESNEFARLISSRSVKDYLSIENIIGYGNIKSLDVACADGYSIVDTATPDTDTRRKLTADALGELAVCLDEDYRAMSANDMMDPGGELFTLKLAADRTNDMLYSSVNEAMSGRGRKLASFGTGMDVNLYYTVTDKNVRAIEWMKDAGVYDSLLASAEEMRRDGEAEAEAEVTEG
jgi:hypothetical protein